MREREREIIPFHIVIFPEKTKPTNTARFGRIFIQKLKPL